MPPGAPILDVEELNVLYGDFVAVESASFRVRRGDSIAIVGPNGNGKTSIATAIAGLTPSSGRIDLFGERSPNGDSVWMVRRGLVLVPERRRLFPQMTVIDNVLLGCYGWTQSLTKARRADSTAQALELFPELKPRLQQRAGTLSGGQQQMTAIARGLAARPKILLIDEPCLGLAEVVSRRLYAALSDLKSSERSVILIEENPARAIEICDTLVRVQNGRTVASFENGEREPVAAAREVGGRRAGARGAIDDGDTSGAS